MKMIKREIARGFFAGNISQISAEGMNKTAYLAISPGTFFLLDPAL
jgi:hypothetical protein